MAPSFVQRVMAETSTLVWVNNPTLAEVDACLSVGVVGCTTNPGFCGSLVKRAPEEIGSIVAEVAAGISDDQLAAEEVQRRAVLRVAEKFGPLYTATGGKRGLVTLQGPPNQDGSPDAIEAGAWAARSLRDNVVPKIAATEAGLIAMERLVAAGQPVVITEVFSLAQLIETCERWLASAPSTMPAFFMSPITGVFGDYLRTQRTSGSLELELAAQAGVVLARKCRALVAERGYPVALLAGGSRAIGDLTGLLGGRMHVTVNYSTIQELDTLAPAVRESVYDAPDAHLQAALSTAFPEFAVALDPAGLTPQDFEDFGPVQHFRAIFESGWRALLQAVAEQRVRSAARAG